MAVLVCNNNETAVIGVRSLSLVVYWFIIHLMTKSFMFTLCLVSSYCHPPSFSVTNITVTITIHYVKLYVLHFISLVTIQKIYFVNCYVFLVNQVAQAYFYFVVILIKFVDIMYSIFLI